MVVLSFLINKRNFVPQIRMILVEQLSCCILIISSTVLLVLALLGRLPDDDFSKIRLGSN